jgi:dipeptidyl aminopeptidase/acylaminoacyl peptidase
MTGLLAQSRYLATTDDGSLLVLNGDGLRPLAWSSSSGDGSLIAFTRELAAGRFQGNVARSDGTVLLTAAGQVRLSRNGRFALFVDGAVATVDLVSGETFSAEPGSLLPLAFSGRSIASDATAVVVSGFVDVVRKSGMQRYEPIGPPVSAVIDDNATTVAYGTRDGRIILLDLASGEQNVLTDHASQVSMSNDGRVLLYLRNDARGTPQVWTMQRDGSGAHALTAEDSGISQAEISGNGRIAYALTRSMHVLRIDVPFSDVQDLTREIIPTAADQPPQIVSLALSPVAIEPGGSAQLCYNVQGATTVSIQPEIGTVQAPQGCVTVHAAAATTYILTASNAAGSVSATTILNVGGVRILSFSNDPAFSPVAGNPVTLTWTTQNAASIIITGRGVPSAVLPINGSVVVNPITNTDYTLTAYGSSGQAVSAVLHVFVR